MAENIMKNEKIPEWKADCGNCFGLCCVALPYAQSADFPFNKDGRTPCRNLQDDYTCRIHKNLRTSGFKGCTVYECYGAGQRVSQLTFKGVSWRDNPETAEEMFRVFPIMQQLHEMLYYLQEALKLGEARPLFDELRHRQIEIEQLTHGSPASLSTLDLHGQRDSVRRLLMEVSKLAREKAKGPRKKTKKLTSDLIGANLKGANLRGHSFRGAYLIAANLKNADLRRCDFLGADLRDADVSGADLTGSIFLTQAQVNSAKGDKLTMLPASIRMPGHWLV